MIFDNSKGIDQVERFNDGINKLNEIRNSFKEKQINIETIFKNYENIFRKVKEKLSQKDELISDKCIEQIIDYFEIKDENEKENLKIMIKSKKYEIIIKSIKFFLIKFQTKS